MDFNHWLAIEEYRASVVAVIDRPTRTSVARLVKAAATLTLIYAKSWIGKTIRQR